MTRAAHQPAREPVVWTDADPAIACPRDFQSVGDGERYTLRLTDVPIEFELDSPRRERGELLGQLTVRTALAGARTYQGILSAGSFNCSSTQTRAGRAKQLLELSRAPQIDWHRLLDEFCIRVLAAERDGAPGVDLRTVTKPGPERSLDIDGIRLLTKHPMILFGDGGSAKSLLALYLAGELAMRGLRVAYADWELTAEDHRARLEQIFGTPMPEITYVRCTRPLTAEADRLRRLVREHRIEFLICDSISFACDGPPEAAEVAGRYFQALRQIGIGSLNLAHTNKSDDADRKPFGSAFWHNGARATWNVKISEAARERHTITVGCYNRKANLGPLLPAVGFRIAFEADRIDLAATDLSHVEDLAAALPLKQRIKSSIERGPRTLADLAEELGANVESVDRTVRRYKDTFTKVSGPDRVQRIALVSSRRP